MGAGPHRGEIPAAVALAAAAFAIRGFFSILPWLLGPPGRRRAQRTGLAPR